jgi:hypothetical protein
MREFEITPDLNNIKKFISKSCSQIVDFYKSSGEFLYHGSHRLENMFIISKVADRHPMSFSIKQQKIFDEKLSAAGFKALRSNSIFCTNKRSVANRYGKIFITFPFNNFEFTWSETMQDLYTNYDQGKYSKYAPKIIDMDPNEFTSLYSFRQDNLLKATTSGNEILITGKCMFLAEEKFNALIKELIA